jgi:hypothetical protein
MMLFAQFPASCRDPRSDAMGESNPYGKEVNGAGKTCSGWKSSRRSLRGDADAAQWRFSNYRRSAHSVTESPPGLVGKHRMYNDLSIGFSLYHVRPQVLFLHQFISAHVLFSTCLEPARQDRGFGSNFTWYCPAHSILRARLCMTYDVPPI